MSTPEASDREPGRRPRGLPANLRRDQPLVPIDNVAGRALMAVIAILTFLAALSAGAAVLAARASDQWRGAISNEMTIQVRPDSHRKIDDDVARAVMLASGLKEVESVRAVPKAESDKLLEPWLGTGLDLVELPVPRLIVLKLKADAASDLAGFGAELRREVPTATLDDHRLWVRRLSAMAGTIIATGFAIVLLVLTAAALAVAFATRGAMAGSRDSVEVLHFVGANDDFIAREFQSRFIRLGLRGGLFGGLAAIVTIGVLGFIASRWSATPEAEQLQALFGAFEIGWTGYGAVILVALVVAVIAGLVSRFTVRRHLRMLA
ncbi:cell division protein FtsX [Bosea sp. Root670]|uniref:cell division protein FtsX n=1 Tax=unclassified Bosea (in: a-proteobacteria) TaxID=2653178 RepID=UPI0007124AD4|nr:MULTISPECIES: cell division protein FtsX [unclassified Bosea (in: a-proteobacteria)]KRE01422.1 cell division protein FtsX [Bosea sp. Root670]TQI73831.1 cell division transport system permease protein [Bosea sp. AK1]